MRNKLVISGLSKSFGRMKAVDDFSLEVEQGELLAVLGPSGCGKSTLLSCIAGIEDADSGVMMLDGECILNRDEGCFVAPEKRNIGFVFQNYALWPHMTVEGNLSYPLRIRKKSRPYIELEVDRIMKLIRLDGKKKRYPDQLSGGEQQRVALGRALIMNPSLLLLDEPLSNLDAGLREAMQDEICLIQKELGLTAIHVTHDQAEAMAMSDRIAVMNKGRIVQIGKPEAIYNKPETIFTAGFMGTNNIIEGVLVKKNGDFLFDNGRGLVLNASGRTENLSGPAYCIVRPEDIAISAEPDFELRSALSAKIKSRVYKGAHFLYQLEAFGVKLRVQSHSSELYEPGSIVSIGFMRCEYLSR